jgi:hypothetical protein
MQVARQGPRRAADNAWRGKCPPRHRSWLFWEKWEKPEIVLACARKNQKQSWNVDDNK